jgi:hypothetical protein
MTTPRIPTATHLENQQEEAPKDHQFIDADFQCPKCKLPNWVELRIGIESKVIEDLELVSLVQDRPKELGAPYSFLVAQSRRP